MNDHPTSGDDEDNDGTFPDGLNVLTRFPTTDAEAAGDRASWPWVTASILSQCGPGEWTLCIEIPETARLANGEPAPPGTPDDDTYYPIVFRDRTEIRLPDPGVQDMRAIFFPEHGDTP